jgi:hypothetical protein
MTFDEIQLMWQQDSNINDDEIDIASLQIPQLHAKYMKLFSDFYFKRKQIEIKIKTLRREKFEYYTGKADPKIYAEKPFDLKILKSEVNMYIESDEDINNLQLKIESFDVIINYLESVLKMISNRTYQIKNVIEWRKFSNGIT